MLGKQGGGSNKCYGFEIGGIREFIPKVGEGEEKEQYMEEGTKERSKHLACRSLSDLEEEVKKTLRRAKKEGTFELKLNPKRGHKSISRERDRKGGALQLKR